MGRTDADSQQQDGREHESRAIIDERLGGVRGVAARERQHHTGQGAPRDNGLAERSRPLEACTRTPPGPLPQSSVATSAKFCSVVETSPHPRSCCETAARSAVNQLSHLTADVACLPEACKEVHLCSHDDGCRELLKLCFQIYPAARTT